ncbi:hypothetical protein [Hymenobacter sp. B81]|uniref:hypothetical protein n=1 Tax=Hymenobacter sp. B81 TaxID=3344878 RepID=UPI0037DC1839
MPTTQLKPGARRLVGLLLIVSGGLLVAAQLLRFGVLGAGWQQAGWAGVDSTYLTLTVLMLLVGVLLVRYGWRMRRDGHVSDEPGDHSIT